MRRGRRYTNLDQNDTLRGFKDLQRWRQERKSKVKDFSFVVPHEPEPDIEYLQHNQTDTVIVWIGHSSFLIQIDGIHLLIDPIWSIKSPFMRRLSPPGLVPDQLPDIDAVLISHAHYDHLQFSSLRKVPGAPAFYVPAGLKRRMLRKRFAPTEELEWWQSVTFTDKGVKLHFVPAQHWTKRTPWDTNSSHWGGWVIEGKRETIYFAGDSGYFRGFREIGSRFDIDIALMPIGAYEPEWFMGPQHVTPEQAVQAYLDTGAKHFIPMHYGTFHLADDTPKEALDRLQAAWIKHQLPEDQLHILKLGEIHRVSAPVLI